MFQPSKVFSLLDCRRIFADVIVYIFAQQHTTYQIEAVAVYMSLMQRLKELIKLSNLCNFQLFASSIEEISAIKNCEIVGWQKS